MAAARYFDGTSAAVAAVTVLHENGFLVLADSEGRDVARWPLGGLKRSVGEVAPDRVVLVPADRPDARLVIEAKALEPELARLLEGLPRGPETRRWQSRLGLVAAFLAVVGFFIFYGVPQLASLSVHLISPQTERKIGASVAYAVAAYFNHGKAPALCRTPIGTASINRLVTRLSAGLPAGTTVDVTVVDVPLSNAFAAPGGYIIVFRGLLEQASSPDAVAGVVAHEMGHAIKRHALRGWLRERGLTGFVDVLIGGVPGGSVLTGVADVLLGSSYSRADEAEADEVALDLLAKAQISTTGLADFFASTKKDGAGLAGTRWLASHPPTAEREARARAASVPEATPALDSPSWIALRATCRP